MDLFRNPLKFSTFGVEFSHQMNFVLNILYIYSTFKFAICNLNKFCKNLLRAEALELLFKANNLIMVFLNFCCETSDCKYSKGHARSREVLEMYSKSLLKFYSHELYILFGVAILYKLEKPIKFVKHT